MAGYALAGAIFLSPTLKRLGIDLFNTDYEGLMVGAFMGLAEAVHFRRQRINYSTEAVVTQDNLEQSGQQR